MKSLPMYILCIPKQIKIYDIPFRQEISEIVEILRNYNMKSTYRYGVAVIYWLIHRNRRVVEKHVLSFNETKQKKLQMHRHSKESRRANAMRKA